MGSWLIEAPPLCVPKVWQVCFIGAGYEQWWDRFLPDGFRHVFLLGFLPEYRQWLYVDPQLRSLVTGIVSDTRAGALLEIALHEGAVLSVPAGVLARPMPWLARLTFYCVPVVCHVLGLRCVAVTPRGLHDYLLQTGAQPLEVESHVRHPERESGGEGRALAAAEPG